MKKVVVDTGVIISLAVINQLELLEKLFDEFYIANAVWEELNKYEGISLANSLNFDLKSHVRKISSLNHLLVIMDYGESESLILYEELNADFLLVDDSKARVIAESLNANCIGSIGLLIKAKEKGLIKDLKKYFKIWLESNRYFSLKLLNDILIRFGETAF